MSQSRAPAGRAVVANHSLKRCTNPGSVSGTARGGLSRISASVSRSACCSSRIGRPCRRLRAAASSFRCLSVRRTTKGDDRGAPLSGSSSTKSSFVSGRISFSRPRVFHSASMNRRLRRSGTLESSTATSGARHVGAVGGGQVPQRHRAFVVKIACGVRIGQIMTTDVAV